MFKRARVAKDRKQCTEQVRDTKTKKVRQCKVDAVYRGKCGNHNKPVKVKAPKPVKKKIPIAQVIRLAAIGLKMQEIADFFNKPLTFIAEKYTDAYKKGRVLWGETTAGKVELYASLGMSQEAVANGLGISNQYMLKHYRDEYDKGSLGLRIRLRAEQVRVAMDPEARSQATMLIFLGKNYLAQRDKFEVVHTYDMDQIEHALAIAARTNPAVLDQFIAHIDGKGDPMEFIRRIETGRPIEDAEFEEVSEDE